MPLRTHPRRPQLSTGRERIQAQQNPIASRLWLGGHETTPHSKRAAWLSVPGVLALIHAADALAAIGAERHVDPADAEAALAFVGGEQLGLVERDPGRRLPLVAIGRHLGERPAFFLRDD